jgi:hypothetical protein
VRTEGTVIGSRRMGAISTNSRISSCLTSILRKLHESMHCAYIDDFKRFAGTALFALRA